MIIGKYKWKNRNNHLDHKQTIEDIIDIILENRGIIDLEDKQRFLSPQFDNMNNPMDLPDMEKAIERIGSAKENNEKITIFGDYDVDGITSTSILYMFFRENGYNIDYYIPDRTNEGYGFNNEALRRIKDSGTSLIISVDTGISAINEVEYANEIGLDMIITDHHECPDILPKAYAVINPKRLDSSYPFKELAGVGVAFKLIHGLAISFNNVDSIWKYIDIVAIGTVADIVPLVDENRIIVSNAFETIPNTWNIGLRAMLEVCGYQGKKITSGTIGFQIGPRLNAAGRMGDAKEGVELFTTNDELVASKIASKLDQENKKRQEIERTIYEEALDKISESKEIKEQNVIVVAGEGWHKGVIGIVASRITELYYKPTIVITLEDGKGTASARSIEGFSMFDALSNSSHYLEKFGGHDMAAGLSLDGDKIDDFRKHINEYGNVILDEEILRRKINIDAHINEEHITIPMLEALEALEPHGVSNPTPVFSYGAKVYNVQTMGADGQHLKVRLYTPEHLIEAVGFHMGDQEAAIMGDQELVIAGNLQRNEWLGKVTPQIIIKDIQSSKEELMKSQFYLSLYKNFPEPTIDNYKVFTKGIETCYINSYGTNNIISIKEQLKYMIPTREDAVIIYRYLREKALAKIKAQSLYGLKHEVKQAYMTEYKVLQILDIFKELGLLRYKYNNETGMITFEIIEGIKTDLNHSQRFTQLSKLAEF